MKSRAAMMSPSSVIMSNVSDPSIFDWAYWMPATRSSFWLMSAATSSVEFTAPELSAMNCASWSSKYSSTKASALLMAPMVVIANVPRCERTSSGWGSASEMHPMALVPWKRTMSSSNFVRNGVFSIE